MKPVLELAAIEHQLQPADADAEGQETENIERLVADIPGVPNKYNDADGRQNADRQIDVEDPAPAEILGQVTAEQRPADRPHDGADTINCHGLAVPFRRIDLQQRRLRQRNEPGATNPLQPAK